MRHLESYILLLILELILVLIVVMLVLYIVQGTWLRIDRGMDLIDNMLEGAQYG